MKSIYYLLAGFLIFLSGCMGEPDYQSTDRVTDIFPEIYLSDEIHKYVDRRGTPITGEFIKTGENGQPEAELIFDDGMIESGHLRLDNLSVIKYKKEDGLYWETHITKNGDKRMNTSYSDHLEDRVHFNVWFDNGEPFVTSDPSLHKMWHENGQLLSKAPLKDGKMHGKVMGWHDNGSLKAENHFKMDEMHGSFKEWDKDGNLVRKRIYEMGELVSEDN